MSDIAIVIRTPITQLGRKVAERLTAAGLPQPQIQFTVVEEPALRFASAPAGQSDRQALLRQVRQALGPLARLMDFDAAQPEDSDPSETATLQIDLPKGSLATFDWVNLQGEDGMQLMRARRALEQVGITVKTRSLDAVPDNVLRHDGVDPWTLAVIQLALGEDLAGPLYPEHDGCIADDEVTIRLADPQRQDLPRTERFPVQIFCVDPVRGAAVAAALRRAGFKSEDTVRLPTTLSTDRLSLQPGYLDTETRRAPLLQAVSSALQELDGRDAAAPAPDLSIGDIDALSSLTNQVQPALLVPDLPPQPKADSDRYALVLVIDDIEPLQELEEALEADGQWILDARMDTDLPGRAVIDHDGSSEGRVAAERLRRFLQARTPGIETALNEEDDDDDLPRNTLRLRASAIVLKPDLPPRSFASGFKLKIYANDEEIVDASRAGAEAAGFERIEDAENGRDGDGPGGRRRADGKGLIEYGRAPTALVEALSREIGQRTGRSFDLQRTWHDGDSDIWIFIPDSRTESRPRPTGERPRGKRPRPVATAGAGATPALPRSLPPAGRTVLSLTDSHLQIGDHVLTRRAQVEAADAALVPDPSGFATHCLDHPTASILAHLAESLRRGEPCLLEGATGAAKTSSVRWLAALTGQPLIRLNLSGQTDTGELIGRYAPQGQGWAWLDGPVIRAMTRGWWLLLDEVNLAEPQVLERLNPILEAQPGLVLAEHDNRVIGGAEHPVHPAFRIVATMNPADYAGRLRLSPAWRDRFTASMIVPQPTEEEYVALARFLATGRQPDLDLWGRRWSGTEGPAPFAALGTDADLLQRLERLARFHAAVERAAGGPDAALGAGRREPYVFTRRSLLAALTALAQDLALQPGLRLQGPALDLAIARLIERYWLARLGSEADRDAVLQLAEAVEALPAGSADGLRRAA